MTLLRKRHFLKCFQTKAHKNQYSFKKQEAYESQDH